MDIQCKSELLKRVISLILISMLSPIPGKAQEVKIPAIPYSMRFENEVLEYAVLGDDHIRIAAPANTDLYTSADGGYSTNKSPRLLFRPDSNFILSSKIKLEFKSKWDAGVLLIYNDSSHYAKFCFENDFEGQPRIVSVVCNEVADDCNSMAINDNEIYYRIIGSTKNNTFGLYYSEDGKDWFGIRGFRLNKTDNLRIGFSAQSPTGKECSVEFLDIDLQEREPNDPWKGD
jgi:uncharacterized protein